MSIIYKSFNISDAIPNASGSAPVTNVVQGSNYPIERMLFDQNASKSCSFVFDANQLSPSENDLSVEIDWYSDTANTGNVVWKANVSCYTPNVDTVDIHTKTPGNSFSVIQGARGTRELNRAVVSIPSSGWNSMAANDFVSLQITRDAVNGLDTMAGNAALVGVNISYSGVI